MTSKAAVALSDLSPEARAAVRRQLGRSRLAAPRKFTREHERRYSLRILAEIAELSQTERRRVLRHALKVNDV